LTREAIPDPIAGDDEELVVREEGRQRHIWICCNDLPHIVTTGQGGGHLFGGGDVFGLFVFQIPDGSREIEIAIDPPDLVDEATSSNDAI
jgi:hypothetical protein